MGGLRGQEVVPKLRRRAPGVGNQQRGSYPFFKTQICRYKREGRECYKGDECMYAHSEEELRIPPPNVKQRPCMGYRSQVSSESCKAQDYYVDLDRPVGRAACTFWAAGHCREGNACKRAHCDVNDVSNGRSSATTESVNCIAKTAGTGGCPSGGSNATQDPPTLRTPLIMNENQVEGGGGTGEPDLASSRKAVDQVHRTLSSQTIETAEDSQALNVSGRIPSLRESTPPMVKEATLKGQPEGASKSLEFYAAPARCGSEGRLPYVCGWYPPTAAALNPYIPNAMFLNPHANQLLQVCQGVPCEGPNDVLIRAGLADGIPPYSIHAVIGLPQLSVGRGHGSSEEVVSYDV